MMTDGNSVAVSKAVGGAKEIPNEVTRSGDASKKTPDRVKTTDEGSEQSQIKEEFVHVPKDLKGYVIGMGGKVVKNIRQISGATVASPKDQEGFTVTGDEEQRARAKKLITQKVEGAKITHKEKELNKVSYYIDEWNLPSECKLKLEQIAKEDGIDLPETFAQYRIKPSKAQESYSGNDDAKYMSKLKDDTLESLRRIKREMETKKHLTAEMWCHFGMVIVRRLIEGDEAANGEWTIEETTNNLGGTQWKTAFKGGVKLNEKILQEHAFDKTPKTHEDYPSRYDLTFLMPNGREIKLSVWVSKKNLGKQLEDIPIPSGHLKNVLQEIRFKDQLTRSRCRGWLVLPPQRYLRADILFPGCEFDCRLTITGHSDTRLKADGIPEEDTTSILARYLSELTYDDDEDDFGLRLSEENLPYGFQISHMRCCKRALYGFMPGFTIVLSKEISKNSTTAKSRFSTAFYLLCDEWEDLLNNGEWEPETLVEKLPDFFRFVNKVQTIVVRQMKETGLEQNVPPEILARGPLALAAYNKALADGKTFVKRVPIMLIGQDRAGKTSLKKSLRGICFDPLEGSTVGIEVDPSCFKVTTETWKTGTTEKGQNPDVEISFERHAAMCVVDNLKRECERPLLEDSLEEIESTFASEVTEIPKQSSLTESAKDSAHNKIFSETRVTLSEDAHQLSLGPSGQNPENSDCSTPCVPENVAAVTETLLQDGWEDNRKDIYSTLWDFSGQSVYYDTHPLFLTARAIYCLVYNLSLNPDDVAPPLMKQGVYDTFPENFDLKTNLNYLDFWMRSVASLASLEENRALFPISEGLTKRLPAVLLVCTHADTPYSKRNPRQLAYKILGDLKKKPYGSHLVDVFVVDNTKSGTESECPEVVRLRQKILTLAQTLPHTNEAIPIKWLKFEKTLSALRERESKWISLESAKVIASNDCGIVEDREFETLVNYLHDLRSVIHFYDSPKLSKLVVLDPQWLVDVFKKVITVQPAYECNEEKFLQFWGKLEEEGILDEELLTHMWKPLIGNRDTYDSLVDVMEKFSLLCCWPSDSSENKSYLVPSMLRSHPPEEIFKLLASAKLPSLFLKFGSGHVPQGLFPRLVLKFFQCGEFWKQAKSKLFHNFARFFTSDDENCSVILLCHSSSVEIVVHKANPTLALAGNQSSVMALSTEFQCYTVATEVTCAGAVRRRLGLMIECMRNEFNWLRDMKYEMCVLCPVCCTRGAVNYCRTHHKERCKEEQCLHFLSISKLFTDKGSTFCDRSASAEDTEISIMHFSHWYDLSGHQLAIGERERKFLASGGGNEQKAIALPEMVRKSLLSQSCHSKEIMNQFKESLKLSQASLERPDAETKRWIRCLAREANVSGRLEVVKSLRNISPAGTTGPLLSENLDVREIPIKKSRQLTIALSAEDDWKLVAEKMGLNFQEIRFLDNRVRNPAEATLFHVAHQRYFTVGNLYDVLADCGLSLIADDL